MEFAGGVEERACGDGSPDALEKGLDGRMIAAKQFSHPLRASNIFVRVAVVDGSCYDERHALGSGSQQ